MYDKQVGFMLFGYLNLKHFGYLSRPLSASLLCVETLFFYLSEKLSVYQCCVGGGSLGSSLAKSASVSTLSKVYC